MILARSYPYSLLQFLKKSLSVCAFLPAVLWAKTHGPVDMFDGKTLKGWYATPRIYVPRNEKFAKIPSDQLYDAVVKHYEESPRQWNGVPDRDRVKNKGVWWVENGVVIGTQVPGTIRNSSSSESAGKSILALNFMTVPRGIAGPPAPSVAGGM